MNRFGRRKFGSMVGSGALALAIAEATAVGGVAFVLDGCGGITIAEVQTWTKVGDAAINTVMILLGGICAPCTIAAPLAVDAIDAIGKAITAWQNAPAADKATAWGKIHTVMVVAFDQITSFFQTVTIPGGGSQLEKTVVGIASLTLSALEGFIKQFFPTMGAAMTGKKQPTVGTTAPVPVAAKVYKSADFKKQFNSIVTSGGYSQAVMH